MRAGLSTIQQTLTPEAANVLNQSIAEAGRRNHGQTTPLHVAATLLSSPSGYLRQACIRSHPNSSHPLQCRALELCFSVALERLPTAQNTAAPPLSNALMAALKRAQAHQRRGCPEQQQQPLLAVKVELDQLIISILDDPSVSRVMREASFSSPAVKATIEQSTNNPTSRGGNQHHHLGIGNVNLGGITSRMLPNPVLPLGNRNVYLNPRLQQGGAEKLVNHRGDELRKLLDIMMRSKKKNPVLVGDSEPEPVAKELLRKIENKELESDGIFKNAQVICLDKGFVSDKSQIPSKIKELGGMIESRIVNGGVVVYLGDLKWLVEQQQHVVSHTGRAAVAEMTKLLARFRGSDDSEGSNNTNKLWLVGTATCETYLRCQVYHSNMETDWDLQALPMASRSPLPGMFPRFGAERFLSNPPEKLNPANAVVPSPLRLSENIDPAQRSTTFCPQCSENYEKELAKLTAIEKSFSEAKQDTTQPSLPQWLRSAKLNTTNSDISDQSKVKTQELQKKWRDTCLHLHPNFHSRGGRQIPPMLSVMNVSDPFARPVLVQPKLQTIKPPLQLNSNQITISPPGSPVRTDLVLGRNMRQNTPEKGAEDQAKDFLGCISSQPQTTLLDKFANSLDADNYKSLLKGLMEKAWWQGEAASKVASAITRCRLGGRERRGGGLRGDIWLLFAGPDRAGKRKVASVLSEKICGANHIMIRLGTKSGDRECGWGKTVIDRIAEAVRRNPFSVIMLEDIDEAEMLVHGSVKRAMERGCLVNSHGREVSLGNAIFILAGDWSSSNRESSGEGHFDHFVDEEKVASVASGNWQLGLVVREKGTKRRPTWLDGEKDSRSLKPRKENGSGLALDLNLGPTYIDDDDNDDDARSYNSSDLTVDHEDELRVANPGFSITSVPRDLLDNVDESVVFKPVDSTFVRREIKKTISLKFSTTLGDNLSLEVEDDVLEKILGGLWHDKTSLGEWVEKVISPGFDRIKPQLSDRGNSVVRLVVESDSGRSNGSGDWLPSSIVV